MSELSQARDPHRHPHFAPARATRRSASGPGHVASTRDVAIYFREDCRTLRDSLQLEMVVAQYCLRMRDVESTSGTRVGDVVAQGVIAELTGFGDPLSHAILRGLADIGPGEIEALSADAVDRLEERGVALPQSFTGVGRASATGAWRTPAGPGEEFALFTEFAHPRGRRHTIALFVDPHHGSTPKHVGLLGPMSDLDGDEHFGRDAMEALDLQRAADLVDDALDASYVAATTDFRVLIAAARARSLTRAV